MKRKTRVDVLNIPIPAALLKLSWPIALMNLAQTLYNLIDAFWLGKLGKVKFAAPTVVFPITFIFMSLSMGLSTAGATLVSQYIGAKEKRMAEKSGMQVMIVSIMISLVISGLGFFFSGGILKLLGIEEPVFSHAKDYLEIIFLGMPFTFLMMSSQAIARGWGDTFFSMNVALVSIFLNIIFDPLMIFGIGFPRMEVVGAAWATVISRVIATTYSLYIFFKGNLGFRLHIRDIPLDTLFVKNTLKIGFPAAVGQAITATGFAVIMGIISRFGPAVVSAYGVGNRVTSMLTMIGFAISASVAIMVGQFLGAGEVDKVDRTIKWGFMETFTFVGTLSVFLFLFADRVTKFFINDAEVIELGKIYFHLVSFSVPLFAMVSIVLGAFNGAGKTIYVAIINITRLWGIRVPLVFLFARMYGFKGVFYAMAMSNALALLLGYFMLKVIRWKERVI